jgi:hypothetical protein
MKNSSLIHISDDGSFIDYHSHNLNEENAFQLTGVIRRMVRFRAGRKFILNLGRVKIIEVSAAVELAGLSDIRVDEDFPYLFDYTEFGLEHLPEEVAGVLAGFPSHFLHFDQLSSLSESVASQFIGSDHALTFDGCMEFSTGTLRALTESASFLSLGLSELTLGQAKVLSRLNADLCLRAEKLPPDVLFALGNNPNLCLAPDYGLLQIPDDGYEKSTSNNTRNGYPK